MDAERNTAMPREFLIQQMAWREALDEVHDGAAALALDAQVSARNWRFPMTRAPAMAHSDSGGASHFL